MIKLKDLLGEVKVKSPDFIISSIPATEIPTQRIPLADVAIGLKLAEELKNWTLKKEDYKLVYKDGKIALQLTPKGKLSVRVKTEKNPNYLELLQTTVKKVVSDYVKRLKK